MKDPFFQLEFDALHRIPVENRRYFPKVEWIEGKTKVKYFPKVEWSLAYSKENGVLLLIFAKSKGTAN